jgi:hypothetical protein
LTNNYTAHNIERMLSESNKVVSIEIAVLKQGLRDLASVDLMTRLEAIEWLADKNFQELLERLKLDKKKVLTSIQALMLYPLESRKVVVEDMIGILDSLKDRD